MKKWIVIALLVLVFQQRDWLMDVYIINTAPSQQQVVMYGTPQCGYCIKARKFFDRLGIRYVEYNVNKNSAARREYTALNGTGTPLIVIGEQVVRGFNPDKLRRALL